MEGNNVVELREKIKNFLDSQSQIKDRFSQPSTSGHHGEPSDEDEEDLCADAAINRSIDSVPDENQRQRATLSIPPNCKVHIHM